MKKVLCIVTSLLLLTVASGVFAKTVVDESTTRQIQEKNYMSLEEMPAEFGLRASAAFDTTYFAVWDFTQGPTCVDESWAPRDFTIQIDDFWHVDDFAGLGGGTFGGLTAIEGAQSLWMGTRAKTVGESLDLCGYATLPGYGNGWSQKWCTKTCLTVTTGVEVVFVGRWDSEPGYDGTTIQVSTCTGGVSDANWLAIRTPASSGGMFDDVSGVDSLVIESVPDSMHTGSIQIRLLFASDGGWSDEDGLWDTDGGIIIDSLSVHDASGSNDNVLAVEDFEAESPGDIVATDWQSCNEIGFSDGNNAGTYASSYGDLYPALTMVQEDPCVTEVGCVWAFVAGSLDNYACGSPPFPGQASVPKGPNARDQYIYEEVVSPVVPFSTTSTDIEIGMYMYPDNPRDNLVYWTYGVRSYVAGCPTNWRDDGFVYRNDTKSWGTFIYDLGDKLQIGATDIQVKTGVRDMCAVWCGVFGTGACHSHAPLWDTIYLYAVETAGPAMAWNAGGMLNDNFPEDGTLTGTVRIDAAIDIRPSANINIQNGDSAAITVTEPLNGLSTGALDGSSWASVYAYVGVYPQGNYFGPQITDDSFRWPVIDSTTAPDAAKWYIVRLDTAFSSQGRTGVIVNTFCLDLNDNLFHAGDQIRYFIAAQSADGPNTWTYYYQKRHATDTYAPFAPSATNDINVAYANFMEVTCLPTQHLQAEPGDILYVDANDGRSSEPYFNTAFDQMGILDKVDRYDVGESGSSALGQFGSRVQDVFAQIIPVYRKIIWNSGTLNASTLGDGTGQPTKADDYLVLNTFLDQSSNLPGVYLSGNGLAQEWANDLTGAAAVSMKGVYMNFNVTTDDHASLAGMPLNPMLIGQPGGLVSGVPTGTIFNHLLGPDTVVAFGGCPTIRQFDVMTATGGSVVEMAYQNDVTRAAILSQTTANNGGSTARVVLSGVSFHLLRDFSAKGVPARSEHLFDIITFLQNTVNTPTSVRTSGNTYSLAQNYPNPFNPVTTIEYTLRDRSNVQLKIYNVAGQLVRTLVNDVKDAGQVHTAVWDGRNDAGQSVSSGVYFYKLTSNNFTQTKKMVLLK